MLEEILMLEEIEGKRRKWQKMKWLDSITNSTDLNFSKFQEIADDGGCVQASVHMPQRVRHNIVNEQQQQYCKMPGYFQFLTDFEQIIKCIFLVWCMEQGNIYIS